jgi:hypothetical protein
MVEQKTVSEDIVWCMAGAAEAAPHQRFVTRRDGEQN